MAFNLKNIANEVKDVIKDITPKIQSGLDNLTGANKTPEERDADIAQANVGKMGTPDFKYNYRPMSGADFARLGIGMPADEDNSLGLKKGGRVKGYSIDGIAKRGKTRAKQK